MNAVDEFALPHVLTFSSIWNSGQRVYSWRWDEALKSNRENAVGMRRDAFLMGLLRERQLATAQLHWHLEPDDARDARQRQTADGLTHLIRGIPHLQRIFMGLLEAIWYGRSAVQVAYGWIERDGRRFLTVRDHVPVNGDKIQYRYRLGDETPAVEDGTPCILVNATRGADLARAETVSTDRGRALLLANPYWRERFLIHAHEIEDEDFFNGEMAGGIHGVGIRSRIYWLDWLRKEWLSNVCDYLERVGQGMLIFYYEAGNSQSEARAMEAAEKQGRNSVIVWPRPIGGEKPGAGVDKLDMPMSGSETLIKLQEHLESIIARFIVGQSLSSRAEATGLGSRVADLHADTKYKIVRFDAQNLGETLTSDLVRVLQKWNYPNENFPIRWLFDVEKPNAKDYLDAARTFLQMGGTLDAGEVRGLTGLSKPSAGAEILTR